MPKKLLSFLLLLAFTSACASTQTAQRGLVKPKPFVTPYEYYSHTRSAVMTEQDRPVVKRTEVQTSSEDTKEDHTQAIIIGTLVGVSVIGGTVAGILLTR